MTEFIIVRSLGGQNFIRPDHVLAIAASEPTKCQIYMTGGVTVPCAEPAKDVMEKVKAALGNASAARAPGD